METIASAVFAGVLIAVGVVIVVGCALAVAAMVWLLDLLLRGKRHGRRNGDKQA